MTTIGIKSTVIMHMFYKYKNIVKLVYNNTLYINMHIFIRYSHCVWLLLTLFIMSDFDSVKLDCNVNVNNSTLTSRSTLASLTTINSYDSVFCICSRSCENSWI